LDFANLQITPGFAITAVLIIGGVIAGAVIMGAMMDKHGKAKFSVPSILFLIVGLIAVFFAKNLATFAVCAVIFLAGYGLMMIMLSAAVRDFTPEDKAGALQGVRMIFCVMLPMIIGPAIGSAITDRFAVKTYLNDYAETVNVPPPHIFLGAAIVALLVFVPLIPLIGEWKRVESERKADGKES
ncbi:MAG: MFS transporter, partial [Clostridia bacterium]|nr:MFS transporter [Clostridia bacterium]